MKLLIVTQVVDTNHPILGFFHRWIEEFAKHCETVHVICLEKGEYDLPQNVHVHSLGKEEKKHSSFVYAWRLWKYSWQLRKEYDAVFCHMNPEYVIAGAPLWKPLGKKITMWYTHGDVRRALQLAEFFVEKIFTAAVVGMNLKSDKVVVTGHGIDLEKYANTKITKDIDLLTVGRISRSKNLEALVDVLKLVRKYEPSVTLTIVGAARESDEHEYLRELKDKIVGEGLHSAVDFVGGVPADEVPKWLSRARVFVHAAQNGSLDKALLEPILLRVPVVTSAPGAKSIPLGDWQVTTIEGFSEAIVEILKQASTERLASLVDYVRNEHSLEQLIPKLLSY